MTLRTNMLLIFALLTLPIFTGCSKHVATITYQHLANSPKYSLNGETGSINGMYSVFMLRGISNKDVEAQPFGFRIKNLYIGDKINSCINGDAFIIMSKSIYFLDSTMSIVVDKGTIFPIPEEPYGGKALLVIGVEGATKDTKPFINYASSKDDSVIMVKLDTNFTPLYSDVLNFDFMKTIHLKQQEFEMNYKPDGTKQ